MDIRVVVVIPIYSDQISSDELISLNQCCKILGKHDVFIVCPKSLNTIEYEKVFVAHSLTFNKLCFDDIFFKSIEGYNELMLSVSFYKSFGDYQYLLIYQLDAFVFRDDLLYWCGQGYDYIGAPWFRKVWKFESSKSLRSVGNGGFSLRNIHACIKILDHKGAFKPVKSFFSFQNSVFLKLKKLPLQKWSSLKFENSVRFLLSINQKTEDQFWALDTCSSYVDFKVAPINAGISFAFEKHPAYLFELNNKVLPFGCHAWRRYDFDFWKDYIEKEK